MSRPVHTPFGVKFVVCSPVKFIMRDIPLTVKYIPACLVAAGPESESSGLVIRSDKNEGLVRMLKIKRVSLGNGLVKLSDALNHAHRAVAVRGPVNIALLTHDEKRLVIVEYGKAGLQNIRSLHPLPGHAEVIVFVLVSIVKILSILRTCGE